MGTRQGIMTVKGTVTVNFDTRQDKEYLYEAINDGLVKNGITDFQTKEISFAEPDDVQEGELEVAFLADLPYRYSRREIYRNYQANDEYSASVKDISFEIPSCDVYVTTCDAEFEEYAL